MAEPFNEVDPLRKTFFINASQRNVATPADDAGKLPQLEVSGKLAPHFIPTVPLNVQEFDASGTWIKPEEGTFALVELWGGGGSGGAATRTSGHAAGGGGGGGAYRAFLIKLSHLNNTENVVIGAGGAPRIASGAGAALVGNPGGVSSFKGISVNGGLGGNAGQGSSVIGLSPGAQGGAVATLISEAGGTGGEGSSAPGGTNGQSPLLAGAGGASAGGTGVVTNETLAGQSIGFDSVGGNSDHNPAGNATATAGVRGGGGGGASCINGVATSGKGGDGYCRVTIF